MRLLARRMRETGREYALRNLKDNIIHLELKPGSMVSENELAAQMGLSRTPVREALMELSKVRLVDVYPQRGSAVALIDHDLVEEARFMRGVLEGAVVELDCGMLTEDALPGRERILRFSGATWPTGPWNGSGRWTMRFTASCFKSRARSRPIR